MFWLFNIFFSSESKKVALGEVSVSVSVSVWSLNRYTLLELNVNHVGRSRFFFLKCWRYVAISKDFSSLCSCALDPEYPVVGM